MPVATQNKITRSCALSFVVGFSMVYPPPQPWAMSHGTKISLAADTESPGVGPPEMT